MGKVRTTLKLSEEAYRVLPEGNRGKVIEKIVLFLCRKAEEKGFDPEVCFFKLARAEGEEFKRLFEEYF